MNKYLLEIGVEEFPAKYIASTKEQILNGFEKAFAENELKWESARIESTPRRFAVFLEGIEPASEGGKEKIKGPAKRIAYKDGEPGPALKGFMRSKGLTEEDIVIEELGGEDYIFGMVEKEVADPVKVLKEAVPQIIRSISNPKSMRWGGKSVRFLRPIRWFLSLYNDEVLKFDLDGIPVSNVTRGHRFLGSQEIEVPTIEDYEPLLEENYVILDEKKRRDMIVRGMNRLAKEKGGNVMHDEELLDEVIHILEYPTPFIGKIPEEYLALPPEVIITPMKDHQRYFPVLSEGKLLPYFISVRNGDDKGIENVIEGNEKVLIPRLEDAKFFYDLDLEMTQEERLEKLKELNFHEGLGTMYDKTERLIHLVEKTGEWMQVGDVTLQTALRAAKLAKTDLVTKMVIEFTELQGVMGRIYALKEGEDQAVANAIEEQYKPRFAGDEVPQSTAGILLSLSDKMDTLCGLYAIGVQVTGSQDPYGLRRSALGILNILLEHRIRLDLKLVIREALYRYVEQFSLNFDYDEVMERIETFLLLRLKNKWTEEYRYDLVDAVQPQDELDVLKMKERLEAVQEYLEKDEDYENLTSFIRLENISEKAEEIVPVDPSLLEEGEQDMYELYQNRDEIEKHIERTEYSEALELLTEGMDVVNDYMDHVMIMVDDDAVRRNRLSMLASLDALVQKIFIPSAIVRD